MDDTLIIDTSTNLIQEKTYELLPVYNDSYSGLSVKIDEYDISTLPNSNMTTLVNRLKKTMTDYSGLGLSSNQCGVFERVFVMGANDFTITCINPKVTAKSENMVKDSEGCLSFPAFYIKIERPQWVDVEFYDENGKHYQTRFEGVTARCFMHELDHLNGVKFTDYFDKNSVTLKIARQRQMKFMKKVKRLAKGKRNEQ